MSQDPIRLLEDETLSARMRDDLRAAGPEARSDYDVDAGLARFTAIVAGAATLGAAVAAEAGTAAAPLAGSGAAASAGAAVKVGGIGLFAKIAGGLVLAGAIGAGVVVGTSNTSAPSMAPATTSAADAPAAPPPRDPPPKVAVERPAEPHVDPAAPVEPASASSPPPSSRPKASSAASAAPTLKEETEHLAKLRDLARTDPARAAAMANEGHARFAKGGVFWQEREMVAITSLAASGRRDEARARAGALIAKSPESPFAERLRRDLGL